MIIKIEANKRFNSQASSVNSYWLFSFGNYNDVNNESFGNLRVFNDDIISAESGFPMHFHRNFEILTIILDGKLTHEDNLGNREFLNKGEIQKISAGSGINHSEFNDSKNSVHLFQIWFWPKKEVSPNYKKITIDFDKNGLVNINNKNILNLNSDVEIFILNINKDFEEKIELKEDEGLFVYVFDGGLEINNKSFKTFDQARIIGKENLKISSEKLSKAILIKTKI